jgi:hypothetical protein
MSSCAGVPPLRSGASIARTTIGYGYLITYEYLARQSTNHQMPTLTPIRDIDVLSALRLFATTKLGQREGSQLL